VQEALEALVRPVRLLAAGGTISMRGRHAVPELAAADLIEQVPALADVPQLAAETVLSLPGAHIALDQALALARRAAAAAATGEGVVLTSGTDTLEELAVLCALVHDAVARVAPCEPGDAGGRAARAPGRDRPHGARQRRRRPGPGGRARRRHGCSSRSAPATSRRRCWPRCARRSCRPRRPG